MVGEGEVEGGGEMFWGDLGGVEVGRGGGYLVRSLCGGEGGKSWRFWRGVWGGECVMGRD